MRVTLIAGSSGTDRLREGWVLDSDASSIAPPGSGRAVKVTRKATALLLLFASRRLDASSSSSLGWVELSEIPNLPEWAGARTFSSLAAQVRREIKTLHRFCPGLVDARRGSQLKGPFRLTGVPHTDQRTRRGLAEFRTPLGPTIAPTAESLYAWLEEAEPVWRAFHYFDKPGEALSNLPTIDDTISRDPLVRTLACVGSARRLRELGSYKDAQRAIKKAEAAARVESYPPIRQHLQALCSLESGWLNYRRGDLDETERSLAAADAIATGGALLKLRGRALSLRSLVRRSRGLYSAALDDLWHAARLFFVEGDLFQLFAVYHNLACLISVEADAVSDASRQRAMFRQALSYSKKNEAYCGRYGIGHNSVLNKLLQVGLHRRLGQADLGLQVATNAERLALESQNFPDAMKAHRHRVALLLEGRRLGEAKEVNGAMVKMLPNLKLRRVAAAILADELAQWREA